MDQKIKCINIYMSSFNGENLFVSVTFMSLHELDM